jgi:pimeloyl-ACP methyl ester carboxylesterase
MGRENYAAAQPDGKPEVLEPPAAGRLQEIRVPTLVMVGDLDVSSSIPTANRIAEGIAGARLIVFPGVAHMVNLERPAEFNRAVLDFLAEVSPAAR